MLTTLENSVPATRGALPVVSDRAMAIDACAAALISLGIVLAADKLVFMSVYVPLVIVGRTAALTPIVRKEWGFGIGFEILFLAACTLVGGFNDWNSVVNHRIYDYNVPAFFPALTTIPEWMLLYWGLILRSLVTLFRWERVSPPDAPRNLMRGLPSSALLKVCAQLILIVLTRQSIYRLYEDPIWSWAPFALAICAYLILFRPTAYEGRLVAAFLIGGPVIEILYIQFGNLHAYHLGWLGGVPLWIALWWVLAMVIWSDLSSRVLRAFATAKANRFTSSEKA
jgi:hypothetical protein